MAYGFNFKTDLIDQLYYMGVYDVVLPFLMVFTIVFAFMQKTKILGEKAKKFNVVIAIIMGILSTRMPWFVKIFQNALPNVAVTIIAVLMLFLIISMFTGKEGLGLPGGGFLRTVILVAPALAVGYFFLSEIDYLPDVSLITDNIVTIMIIAAFAIVIALIVGDDTKGKKVKYGLTKDGKSRMMSKEAAKERMWNEFFKTKEYKD